MVIYVNAQADSTESKVAGIDNNTQNQFNTLFAGDILPLEIYFTDGQGNFADFTGQAGQSLILGVGEVKSRTIYTSTNLTQNGSHYEGTLNLDTTQIKDLVAGLESITSHLEIQISYYGGNSETLAQIPVTIRQQLIEE